MSSSSSTSSSASEIVASNLPDYLRDTYHWAYLNHRTLPWLDRHWVVSAILWGNANRLMREAVAEFSPGQRVLQAACVYGDFSRRLLDRLTDKGKLVVADVAPIQLNNLQRKLTGQSNVQFLCRDLGHEDGLAGLAEFDSICCFFLLHELPADARHRVVDRLLARVRVGGKVVFTDYHRPHGWHPLRPIMAAVFRLLEPFAPSLLASEIREMSPLAENFRWTKKTSFGGLYQKVTATRLA